MKTTAHAFFIETEHYSRFKFLKENRPLAHRPKLIESIKTHGLLMPIDVDDQFNIIDGQHRFEACRTLGVPVKYRVVNYGRNELFEINNTQQRWDFYDWLTAAKNVGHESTVDFIRITSGILSKTNANTLAACFGTGSSNMLRAIKAHFGLVKDTRNGTQYRVDDDLGFYMLKMVKTVKINRDYTMNANQIIGIKSLARINAGVVDRARLQHVVVIGEYYNELNAEMLRDVVVRLYNKGLRKAKHLKNTAS